MLDSRTLRAVSTLRLPTFTRSAASAWVGAGGADGSSQICGLIAGLCAGRVAIRLATIARWLCLLPLALPKQLRQPRDVECDAARLVGGEHLGLPRVGLALTAVQIGDSLTVRVTNNVAAGHL